MVSSDFIPFAQGACRRGPSVQAQGLCASWAPGDPARLGAGPQRGSAREGRCADCRSGEYAGELLHDPDEQSGAGTTDLRVTSRGALTCGVFATLGANDLLLIYQARGATIDTTDGPSYGTFTLTEPL